MCFVVVYLNLILYILLYIIGSKIYKNNNSFKSSENIQRKKEDQTVLFRIKNPNQ